MAEQTKKELEKDEGTMCAYDHDDFIVNEKYETLGNPKSSEKEKVGGDVANAKRAAPRI